MLSQRELAVLGLLPSMLSLDEIATDLTVSVNTVKSHVRSIYTKLGVSSRRMAVLPPTSTVYSTTPHDRRRMTHRAVAARIWQAGDDHGSGAGRRGDAGRPLHQRPLPAGQGDRPDRRGRCPDGDPPDDSSAGPARVRREDRGRASRQGVGGRRAGFRAGRAPARLGEATRSPRPPRGYRRRPRAHAWQDRLADGRDGAPGAVARSGVARSRRLRSGPRTGRDQRRPAKGKASRGPSHPARNGPWRHGDRACLRRRRTGHSRGDCSARTGVRPATTVAEQLGVEFVELQWLPDVPPRRHRKRSRRRPCTPVCCGS